MKYSFLLVLIFVFVACTAQKEVVPPSLKESNNSTIVQDLIDIPQDIEYYTSYIQDDTYKINNKYEAAYFSMWDIKKPEETLEEIKWPFKYFDTTKSYGENFLRIKQSFFDTLYKESNFQNYLKLSSKALTLKYTHIRALPTVRPLLMDPSLAGEGFPFDYLQNSSINANVPVFASHYSLDKQWIFVFSSFTYGWIKSTDIVLIEDKHALAWKNAKQLKITKEGVSLFTQLNEPLFDTRIGMLFSLIEENKDTYTVLTVSKYKNNEPMFHKTKIDKSIASIEPLFLNKDNINKIIKEISKTNYGWGGVYEQRDCSSTLMDLYAPFGIALPRNSSKQAKVGQIIDLSSFNNQEKEKFIKENAIPFETLLYKKGHIVLYVGIHNNEIVIFHNTWGIKTKSNGKEGRFIIGKTIFSTLKIAKELDDYDESAELLRNIKSMNIITR